MQQAPDFRRNNLSYLLDALFCEISIMNHTGSVKDSVQGPESIPGLVYKALYVFLLTDIAPDVRDRATQQFDFANPTFRLGLEFGTTAQNHRSVVGLAQ